MELEPVLVAEERRIDEPERRDRGQAQQGLRSDQNKRQGSDKEQYLRLAHFHGWTS